MAESFIKDLQYLAKIILVTFLFLSFAVMFNKKIIEGIILISVCIQMSFLWILIQNYDITEDIMLIKRINDSKKFYNYLKIFVVITFFVISINLLFRGLVIVHHSFINYGVIKAKYLNEIYLVLTLGSIFFILFAILYRNITKTNSSPEFEK